MLTPVKIHMSSTQGECCKIWDFVLGALLFPQVPLLLNCKPGWEDRSSSTVYQWPSPPSLCPGGSAALWNRNEMRCSQVDQVDQVLPGGPRSTQVLPAVEAGAHSDPKWRNLIHLLTLVRNHHHYEKQHHHKKPSSSKQILSNHVFKELGYFVFKLFVFRIYVFV